MSQSANIHEAGAKNETKEQVKLQLERYLEQQSESVRSLHKWMKRLEVGGVGIIVAIFLVALYITVTWKSVNPIMIPVAWFTFAASLSLMVFLSGLHTILIRAYPPVILPGKVQKFVSGSGAVWIGAASIVGSFITAIIWVMFVYSMVTFNMALIVTLTNILGVVVSISIVGSIAYSFYQKATQSR